MFSKEIQLQAINMYLNGVPTGQIQKEFNIKGSGTLYTWLRHYKTDGESGLNKMNRRKTKYTDSFKIKVITWRLTHHVSYPITAKKFGIRSYMSIWQWERDLETGRLKTSKQRRTRIMSQQQDNRMKQLEEENERLRIKVAYLEKLDALVQKKSQIKTKRK